MSVQPIPSLTPVRQRQYNGSLGEYYYKTGRVLGVNIFGDDQTPFYMVEWEDGTISESSAVEVDPNG